MLTLHKMTSYRAGIWALLLVLLLAACGGEEPTPEPTAAPTTPPQVATATATSEPTAASTETAVPAPTETAVPAPTETAVPAPTVEPTPAVTTIEEQGVTFSYSPDLGISNVTVDKVPAQLLDSGNRVTYLTDVPEFIRVTMNTPQGDATMFVRPIRNAEGTFFSSQPASLTQYFTDFEAQVAAEAPARVDQQQIRYMAFGNGRGLRAITYAFDEPGIQKITNDTLYYFYDGVTDDGRYYVNFKYPIRSNELEDGGELAGADLQTAQANFDSYASLVLGPLDALPLSAFEPDLALLDEIVESITVAADASTTVSELANDPNCTNNAAFVRDISIPDASIINPGQPFQKVWEVRNTGSCTWTPAYTATFVNGNEMGWTGFVQVERVAPGETFQIAVDLIGPQAAGIYEGRWQMVDESLNPFGEKVYVTIIVPEEPIELTPTPAGVVPTPIPEATVVKECTDAAEFVQDVTIADGQTVNPGERFEKIWEVRNTGTCTWTTKYSAAFIGGDSIGWDGIGTVGQEVAPGETFQIKVNLRAPQQTGIYEGRWQMVNDIDQPFGVEVFVTIFVPTEPVATATPES